MICTFIGHRDTPDTVREILHKTVEKLIKERNVTKFYVGNNGNFDRLALSVLKELSKEFPHIEYYVVYAYLPQNNDENYLHTIYPEGIENKPKRFAIDFRNKWMLNRGDILITYVKNNVSNSAKFAEYAKKKGKEVINIFR